jgi:pimeloyl-ACP methyl ester carboxylesterase
VALLSLPAIPLIGDLLRYTVSPLIGRMIWPIMLRQIFGPSETPVRFKDNFPVWMTLRPGQLRASAAETALMIPSADKLSSRYHELTMPVVIMSGANDRHALKKLHSERLHKELPQSEFLVAPGAGHMIQHLVPDQVMSAIDMAVKTIPPMHAVRPPASASAVH